VLELNLVMNPFEGPENLVSPGSLPVSVIFIGIFFEVVTFCEIAIGGSFRDFTLILTWAESFAPCPSKIV